MRGDVEIKSVICCMTSAVGWRTTVPEFSWLYGRGLVEVMAGGSAVGCSTAVCAQFSGFLIEVSVYNPGHPYLNTYQSSG